MKGEFYKMDFREWNVGTVELTLEQEAAYLRLCHAMYDVGGPVPPSSRFLQSIFRCGNVKAAALVRQLIAADKIVMTADGKLSNRRVMLELADRERLSNVRRKAGEKGGSAHRVNGEWKPSESEWKPSESEYGPSGGLVSADKSLETLDVAAANAPIRGEEIREEKKEREREKEREKETRETAVSAGTPPKVRKVRNRALPEGWQPGERSDRVCRELGRSVDWMHSTAAAMRSWAESKGEVRADWDATHDGWMRREAKDENNGALRASRAQGRNNPFFDIAREIEGGRFDSSDIFAPARDRLRLVSASGQ